MKKFLIILILISMIVIAGCGEKPECTVDSDCHAGKCATAYCDAGKCNIDYKDNCCGNNIKEEIEDGKPGNSCTCPQDYGECEVPKELSSYGDLFSASCVNDECNIDLNTEKQKITNYPSELKRNGAYNLDLSLNFNNPFNTKRDLIELKLSPRYFSEDMKYFKLISVKITITKKGSNPNTVVDETIDRYIWTEDDDIDIKLPFSILSKDIMTDYTDMSMSLKYEYEYNGKVSVENKDFKRLVNYRSPLKVVIPPMDYEECNDCDDGNDATRDYCPDGMAYCLHEPIDDECGNYVCEQGENKCTCPQDCGPCTGSYSDNLNYGCVANTCQLVMVKQKPYSLIDDGKSSGIYLAFTLDMVQPIDVKKDTLKFTTKLQQYDNTIKPPIEILEVILTDNNNQKIAEQSYSSSNKLTAIGSSFSKQYPLSQYYLDEREVKTKVKYQIRVKYTYLKKTSDGIEEETRFTTFSGSFNNIIFTEPGAIS